MQPCLSAALGHGAVGAPTGKFVVKSFVGSTKCFQTAVRLPSFVKIGEIAYAQIRRLRHDPGKTSIADYMGEAAAVLEDKNRLARHGVFGRLPINRIGTVHIEIADDRPSILPHVRWRIEVIALDILELLNQSLLRRTSAARTRLDCTLINNDRDAETGMALGLFYDKLRGLVTGGVGAVPVNHDAVNAAAGHILNLAFDLVAVGRTVSDVHVLGVAEPQHQMGVDLGSRAGIQQRMDIQLADVARAEVAVRLRREIACGAGVV